jgi:hypothetical protein
MPGQKRVFVLDVPGIHVLLVEGQAVDGRDKPGHDEGKICSRIVRKQIYV